MMEQTVEVGDLFRDNDKRLKGSRIVKVLSIERGRNTNYAVIENVEHWDEKRIAEDIVMGFDGEDEALIAAAVNALPALLDEIERLRAFVDSLGVDANEDHNGEWWDGYRQAQREVVLRASEAARQAGGDQ